MGFLVLILFLAAALNAAAGSDGAISTREMERINWMEFKEHVQSKITTVLLPTGTLEPHGAVNNGADNTAPFAIAMDIAPRVNAMVAPSLPYGITGSMTAFPGAMRISEDADRPFVKGILLGFAKNGFRKSIIVNSHGAPQTSVLTAVADEVAQEKGVRTLVVSWWSFCSDVTKGVFGDDFRKVCDRIGALIEDTISKWDKAGL